MKLRITFGRIAVLGALATLLFVALGAAADTLDDIKTRGKMVVAIDPTFPPYEYTDSAGKIIGYTPAIMEAAAKKMGVGIEYQTMAFSGIIPGLLAKSFDVEGSSLNVTAERAKRVRFTVPFGKSANGVLTRADDLRVPAAATVRGLIGFAGLPEKP